MEMGGGKNKAKPAAGKPGGKKVDTKKKQPAFSMELLQALLSTHAIATISPTTGKHTIYFVFKNEKAKAKEPIMQVSAIHFKNSTTPVK
ncbi:MAG TPA: hypothetical protein PLQ32_13220, partial [Flavihumibacter sp.]|nr:hypothetical protein [Flavihumibacter sp.]